MVRGLFSCFGHLSSSFDGGTKRRFPHYYATTATSYPTADELIKGGPVVVELFSSQGCATSREAEMLFTRLGRGDFELEVPVILMAYHVDYWDYNGWKDPFGSTQWTVRQKSYVESFNLDTTYTPQAKFRRPAPESLQISLTGSLRAKVDSKGADIMVSLFDSGLITDCRKGANQGRILPNDFVVRRLQKLCSVKDLSEKKTVTGTVDFKLWPGFSSSKCAMAVFIQQHGSRHIFGAQRFHLPENL
ncbi:Protein of unknown function DUF1223 [Cynara cardunculus var. scolymus]|uniref:Uncharacterized protein n=1 Tax=Cynara cardunculus var. scolymus TaxID=59895 RepID=A0A118JYV1_CYNCS|nr:Protein of unknown function DUF1223 [Cynara cardunculus var. scolymus]